MVKNESVHHKKEMDLTYDELKEEKNRLVKLQKDYMRSSILKNKRSNGVMT